MRRKLKRDSILRIQDKEGFIDYVLENADDPDVRISRWVGSEPPEKLVVSEFYEDPDESYYRTYGLYEDEEVCYNYWDEDLLIGMLENGIIVKN